MPRLLHVALLVLAGRAAWAQAPVGAIYLDPDRPPEQRARDLVSRLTLDQKVRQMQNGAPAIPALGIPAYNWWNEGLHGVGRAGLATVFPQAIGLAATWDTTLMFRVADAISTEARAKYHEAIRHDNHAQYFGLTYWSPNINIFRDPRWGRGQETYGEDPFLTGRMAVAFIKGMQGDDPKYLKVVATAKHFAVHSGPESSRHSFDAQPSARDLHDTYLPAFRAAMVEGGAFSLMCAYNRVAGVPACANTDLLQKTLRGEWGFTGFVVSDCGAIRDFYSATGHRYSPSAGEASAAAVKAGTDLTCGTEYASLVAAVAAGQITEAEIDRSLERLFVGRFKLGMFDPPERVPYASIPYSEVDSPAHRALALSAARASIVLLKNERQTLPLKPSVRSIAVIGPSADDPVALLGNYNGFSSRHVTPLSGIASQFAGKATVRFALGAPYVGGTGIAAQAIIAVDALTPPDTTAGTSGVRAEYFDNADLQSTAKLQRIEERPLLPPVPDRAVAAAGVPTRGYSVRWTGVLRPPVSGEYVFGTRSGGANVRVFIDDRDALPAPPGRGQTAPTLRIPLEAGHAYAFRVEYRQAGNAAGGGMQVTWVPPAEPLLTEAVASANAADVTIAFVGLNPNLEGEQMNVAVPGFAGGDRTDLELPEPQDRMLRAVLATGKPVIVVLTSGSAVAIRSADERAAAVLAAWYGGEEIGTAIAETLTGANNPAGRLPVTFYRNVDQLPSFDDYAMNGRTYRYFTGSPLYPFGYGLSFSTFAYSALQIDRIAASVRVTARVKNTSSRDGDEVVQLYVSGGGAAGDPIRELRGFQRVHLRAGESRDVVFTLRTDGLPRAARISVGGGQPIGSAARVEGGVPASRSTGK